MIAWTLARRLHLEVRPASSSRRLDAAGIGSCRPGDGPAPDDSGKCAVASCQAAREVLWLADSPRLEPPLQAGVRLLDETARGGGLPAQLRDDTELPRTRTPSCDRSRWLCDMRE